MFCFKSNDTSVTEVHQQRSTLHQSKTIKNNIERFLLCSDENEEMSIYAFNMKSMYVNNIIIFSDVFTG